MLDDPGVAAAAPKSVQEQRDALVDSEKKISPLTFPVPSVSPEYLNSAAAALRRQGESISQTGGSITAAWAGLSECYTAPESETLLQVLDPVATDGENIAGGLASAATALETFAENVQSIKTRWSNLQTEAFELRSRINEEGEDWNKASGWDRVLGNDSPLEVENRALVAKGEQIIEDYVEDENECADAINVGIPGRTTFEKHPEGDGALDPNVFYHGYEQDLSELAVEWGSEPAGTDHGWWIDAGAAVWDFGVGAVEGTGAMLGVHSSEGWLAQSWGDSLKEYHWDNLTSAAALVGMYDAESDSLGWTGGEGVKEAWKDLAHSVVPWEEWGERPGYVIGTAVLNIGAMVGGAVLTATGVGSVVGVPLMAWRGAAILDGMGSSGRGGSGLDVDLSDLPSNTQINAQVSSGQMEIIKAYMDHLVNPVYPDTGDLGGSSDQAGEASGAGRGSTSGARQQGDASGTPVSAQRAGEEQLPTGGQLDAFEQMILNEPDLVQAGDKYRPSFKKLDDELGESGGDSWSGGSGLGRQPAGDGPSGEMHRGTESNPELDRDQSVDLSDTGEPGSRRGSSSDSGQATASEHSRSPVAVLDRESNGSGNDGPGGRDDRDVTEGGQGRTEAAGGTLAGGGSSSGGSDGPGHGSDLGQGHGDSRDQNGSQDDGSNSSSSREGSHQGNPWDKEWNNEKLDERYRPPTVSDADRQRTIEKGVPPKEGDPKYPGANTPFAEKSGLKPDSVYDVKGRGRFYTDGSGKVSYIDTHPGQKGDRNPDLRVPKEDARYAVDVLEHPGRKYFFETDIESRTTHAHGELRRIRVDEDGNAASRNSGDSNGDTGESSGQKKSKSDPYRSGDQSKEGAEGRRDYTEGDNIYHPAEWDGGHFFGTGFGGSGHRLNIYSQLRELNQPVTGSNKETNFFGDCSGLSGGLIGLPARHAPSL
ncbi:hypothetical protein NE857_29800 [Nocardiopsis exhalans]|uniref:Uncharacterized protein n=1 Tax=Nocardiopsis exhalans TaxID=163604 RepID=A0ABY5D4U3_9ACTN|nr:hypothetical protein [Nocardiopsis exhalans]USY19396.1 hypothetical protein NE857_29800 [Nocardiopsis exhalans]